MHEETNGLFAVDDAVVVTQGQVHHRAQDDDVPLALKMAVAVLTGWGVQAWTLLRAYTIGGVPLRCVPLYSLGCWVVARIMLDGARDLVRGTPLVWGQREDVLDPRN